MYVCVYLCMCTYVFVRLLRTYESLNICIYVSNYICACLGMLLCM